VVLPSFLVASTKPGAARGRREGWLPSQGRGWFLAPRDRVQEAGVCCLVGHDYSVRAPNVSQSWGAPRL
jgi:hypothetical protein